MALAVLVAAITLCSVASAEEPRARVARAPVPLDGVAAVVDEAFIFRSDVDARVRHHEPKLSKDPVKHRTELADLANALLASMIDEILFLNDAAKLGIEATDADVNAGIASVAQSNKMDRKQLEIEVMKTGYSIREYREEIRKQIIEQRWLLQRAGGKIDRTKMPDSIAFQAALAKQRERLLVDLRSRAYIEVR